MKSETFQEQIDREQKMLAYNIRVVGMVDKLFNAPEDDRERWEYEKHQEEDHEG